MYFITDWVKRVDFDAMRKKRLERLRQSMEKFRLDGLLVFKFENVRYITGHRPLWMPTFVLQNAAAFTKDCQEPICWPIRDDTPHRQATMYWMKPDNVRPFPGGIEASADPRPQLDILKKGLEDVGFKSGRLGIDIITIHMLDMLRQMLPNAEIVHGDACMIDARLVKTEEEVEIMRQGCNIVDVAFDTAFKAIAPGVRECEVLGEVMRVFYRFGMEIPQCNLIVASGPNTAPMMRFAGDRLIQNGDLVFMDLGGCFNGIFAEATRTAICGKPNETQKAIYKTAYEIDQAVFKSMKPGATAEDMQQASLGPYKKSPFYGYMQKAVIAHGIGIAAAEPPWIAPPETPTEPLTLVPGITVSVVPTILVPGVPGGGGVRLEDQVVVTDTGLEVMTLAPYDEKLLA